MSYKFDDKDYPEGTVWVWRLLVECTGAGNNSVRLTTGRFTWAHKEGISSQGYLFLVAPNLDEAQALLGNRLLSAERLGSAFMPAEHVDPAFDEPQNEDVECQKCGTVFVTAKDEVGVCPHTGCGGQGRKVQ